MVDPTIILSLGMLLFAISIYNFIWIGRVVRTYISEDEMKSDDSESRSIKMLTKIPLNELNLIKGVTITTLPMLFASLFFILYGIHF